MPLRILPPDTEKRKAKRGQFRTAKKYVPDVAKTAQHPQSQLKTQKELKKITDSAAYKKSDYKSKTEMLGGKVYNKGGRAGYQSGKSVTRFRSSGPEGKPHSTKEGRSAEAQRAYMRKFGPRPPRRKTLSVTDPYKKIREKRKFSEAGFKPLRASKQSGGRTNLLEELGRVEAEPSNRNRRAEISRVHGELNKGYAKGGPVKGKHPKDTLRDTLKKLGPRTTWKRKNPFEALGGGEEGKPHSTEKGRIASGARKVLRHLKTKKPKTIERKPRPEYKPKWPKRENIMTPLRAKHGIGSLVKKVISKVIKPKPKPKGKGLGSGIKPSEMKDIIPKKDRKLYLKEKLANPLPTHLRGPNPHRDAKLRNKESKKLFKTVQGKASGGRIGLKHGSAQSHYLQHGYGPTKTRLRTGKPKIAIKGWS